MREAIPGNQRHSGGLTRTSRRRHQASSDVIRRHQAQASLRLPNVIKRHQASSGVIRRHQAEGLTQAAKRFKAEHNDGDELCSGRRPPRRLQLHERWVWIVPDEGGHQRSSVPISSHHRSSAVINDHQCSSVIINGRQWSSEVISGHQRSSVVISSTSRSSAY